ncbi:MAG: GNAT family N-acetyltransferase [Oscillospiraceae bacterium]|nr:GNAT family N-acetyltransferase [Oscillospiraceae bacterium]
MVFKETEFQLKDGRNALFRSPCDEDAEEMLRFIIKACGETEFLMKYPEEYADFTLEQEKSFLHEARSSPDALMIACLVDGRIAGNCQITFRTGMKERHRASVAIALLREFWNLGIGTEMFEEMIRIAEKREGVRQIELDFVEGNSRARNLYEKMGFRITGIKPDAIRMKDGTFVNEYMMMKLLMKEV